MATACLHLLQQCQSDMVKDAKVFKIVLEKLSVNSIKNYEKDLIKIRTLTNKPKIHQSSL